MYLQLIQHSFYLGLFLQKVCCRVGLPAHVLLHLPDAGPDCSDLAVSAVQGTSQVLQAFLSSALKQIIAAGAQSATMTHAMGHP